MALREALPEHFRYETVIQNSAEKSMLYISVECKGFMYKIAQASISADTQIAGAPPQMELAGSISQNQGTRSDSK